MADKEYILQEIRRTAVENGGVGLGTKRFSNETGIRETEWGRHWVRWSDALVEAGITPNEFITAYPDELLLQLLAELTRELNHFPLTRELRMKGRRDRGFPAEQAFRRLGSKSELAEMLAAYCQARPDLHSIVPLCLPHVLVKKEIVGQARLHVRIVGEVYLFKVGRHYKIGKTNSVGRREYELAIQLPEKGVLVHAIKTDDPSGIEEYWHKRFSNRRLNGEWFELSRDEVAAFKWRKFM